MIKNVPEKLLADTCHRIAIEINLVNYIPYAKLTSKDMFQ